ncbi:MAG: hypothetical protein PHY48_13300 [Candidatus Cloacimonetes bacterium]|jgi:hypothetical protein|nr:hypothetical protein [Candidatus Cloacimonadota bacterium]
MTNKMTEIDKRMTTIASTWKKRIENRETIKAELVKAHGTGILDSRKAGDYAALAEKHRMEMVKQAGIAMRKEQEAIETRLKDLENERQRKMVQISSGNHIVKKYAINNRITEEAAQAELDKYAAGKKTGFKAEILADQYAAIRNHDNLQNELSKKEAGKILDSHMDNIETQEQKAERKHYSNLVNMAPLALMDYYAGLGNLFEGKFQD